MTGSGTPSQGKKQDGSREVPPLRREILPRQEGALLLVRLRRLGLPAAATPGSRSPATTDDRALSLFFALSVLVSLALASAFLAGSLRPLSDTFWLLWSPTRPPGAQPLTPRIADGEYGSLDRRSLRVPAGGTAAAAAYANTVTAAEQAERGSATRGSGSPSITAWAITWPGTTPEVLLGRLAGATDSIRLGTGAVLLNHYSPYKVAEAFGTLDGLAPGRIDAGPRSGQRLARVRPGARHGPTRREPGRGPRGTYPCGREPSVRRLPR